MRRLRILHLGKYYPPVRGGMETVLRTLCRGESHAAQTSALVTSRGRKTTHETIDGVPVTRVGRLCTIGAVAVAPTLPFWLVRSDAEVIVLHEPNPMALVAYFLVRPKTPLVVWFHSEVVRPDWRYRLFYRPFLEFALRRVARIVVSSPPMLNAPALGPHRARCLVIPYGLDPETYRLTDSVISHARALRDGPRGPVILFIGRLVPYKGLDVLLNALPGLGARTVIVGSGPQLPDLEGQVRALGLGERVRFTGDVPDEERLAWLHACDVLVLPSVTRQEAFGMVQLEAMLSGRPVVSTDLPTGTRWVNVHGVTGLVVRAGDSGALRDGLEQLLADRDLREHMGAAARARAMSEFTADRMCTQTVALYADVVRTPRSDRQTVAGTRLLKRAFDLLLSATGLIMSSPLWAIFAVAIKLQDGGTVFYRQERSGLDGVPFHVLKFRSMIPNAEAQTGAVQAQRDDPRVTTIGRFLRATALDELPQLWNILRGDMSFVGPRALRPGEIEASGDEGVKRLEDVPGFAERSRVRPGLTGIAQIYAPRDIPRRLKFRYDLFYVRRQSFWLDLRLVLLSFWITFRGAWEAHDQKF